MAANYGNPPPYDPNYANNPEMDSRTLGLAPKDMHGDPNAPDAPVDQEPVMRPVDLTVPPGYEFVTARVDCSNVEPSAPPFVPPPAYDDLYRDNFTYPPEEFKAPNHITEEEAREALLRMVAQHCCYGTSAAKKLMIRQITASNALHLSLETFTETRSTDWQKCPYIAGQMVDGPQCGRPPAPWEIPCNPSALFTDQTCLIEVPHTSQVTPCPQCMALGHVRCTMCFGRGYNRCSSCGGGGYRTHYSNGQHHRDRCSFCFGSGRSGCMRCHRTGRIICMMCRGHRNIRWFIQLAVVFKNNVTDHVIERTDMTDSLIKTAQGETILEQTQLRVGPITSHPEREICEASHRIIANDTARFGTARILMQRQRLRSVPVSECAYTHKDKTGRFWVYGKEQDVEAPDYPDTCCWGCNIV